MRRIDLTDAGFLLMEKRETPMHVGGVNLFTLPQGVNEQDFLAYLTRLLRSVTEFRKPFGEYVTTGRAGPLGPLYWEEDRDLDMDYHVRHSALPQPGRYRELFILVSRLHSTLLDRNRPLWEVHLIEGLQNRQFALYIKVHHAAIDGVGAMHMTQSMMSTDPSEHIDYSPFSLEAYERYKQRKYGRASKPEPRERDLRAVADVIKQQFDSSANLFGVLKKYTNTWMGRGGDLSVPWHHVPRTSINSRVSGARRFVAQSWSFDRLKAVCKLADATVNDVVLAMCSGALRRYLTAQNELPAYPLKAMVPVSIRQEGDLESSNAICFITADLATNIKDPGKRLAAIQESMHAGKEMISSLSSTEAALYTQLAQAPILLTSLLGIADRFPAFSTVISNVPGPRQQLYLNGAQLDGIYPASVVFDGFSMNITLVSYNNKLDFGIIACRRSAPGVQRMIDDMEDSLQELEALVGIGQSKKKAVTASKKPATKIKAKAKAKVKKAKVPKKSGQ